MLDRFLSLDELPELMQSEARRRALLDHLPLPVFLKDAELTYSAANPAFARLLHTSLDRVLGKSDADFFAAGVHHRLQTDDRKVLQAGVTLEKEERIAFDGQWRTLRFRKAPVFGTGGVCGVVGFCWDLTEVRLAEAQAKHKQKMDAVAHLAGGIAHDFNNLLTGVLANLALARQLVVEPSAAHAALIPSVLTTAESAAQQAALLTRQLLGFARRLDPRPEVLCINPLAWDLASTCSQEIDLRLAERLWPVRADRGHVLQALEHVVRFAREGVQAAAPICIETMNATIASLASPDAALTQANELSEARPGEFVRVIIRLRPGVRISGPLPALFDPFTSPLSYHRGASLALAMAHGLVKEQEGWMDCRLESDFLSFALYLPRWSAAHDESGVIERTTMCDATVLLVDDHAVVRRIGADMLESLGYRVLAVGSAAEAIELVGRHPDHIGLVLLDVTLPGESCDDFADELRRLAPSTRLFLSAAYPTGNVRRAVMRLQADGFVAKPFQRGELARALQSALAEAESERAIS